MTYLWETKPDGRVLVSASGDIADLTLRELGAANQYTAKVDSWSSLARRAAKVHQVPVSWLLAVIYAESGGDPKAESPKGAIGLMQVVPKYHQTNRVAMFNPKQNVLKGASIYRRLMTLGLDLPQAASGYNAGLVAETQKPHTSSKSPWGLREDPGYIDRVVRANNWYIRRIEAGELDLEGPPIGLIGGLLFLSAVASGGVSLWLARSA